MGITRPRPDGGGNKKSPRGIGPRRCSSLPFGVQNILRPGQDTSRSGVNFLKLVIYRTIDVFTVIPPTSFLHPPACNNMSP